MEWMVEGKCPDQKVKVSLQIFVQIQVLLTKDGLTVVTGVDALEVASAVVLVVVGGEGEGEGQAPEADEDQ